MCHYEVRLTTELKHVKSTRSSRLRLARLWQTLTMTEFLFKTELMLLESVNNSQDRPPSCLHCDVRIRKCVDSTRESYLQAMLWHTAPKAPKAHLRGPRSTRSLQKGEGWSPAVSLFFSLSRSKFRSFLSPGSSRGVVLRFKAMAHPNCTFGLP